ncbi:MAG TPA: ABC transporter ATP-binding protein [Candidatus Thermoplasmatota archaeon]|nr:ABC transporter ATP-binding protein [Candidatus Thermoplasmatota archaeon]
MVLELRAVTKRYGDATVLKDVNLTIDPGEMVVVTGRSGSGKSTMFKLMAGLDRPSSGEVLLEGRSLADLDDAAMSRMRLERLGLVFQSVNLLPDLSVEQNVRLPLDLRGVPRAAAQARAVELLARMGLRQHARKRPHQLSGGQAQRVAIARALANQPAIILADEPTGSLDRSNAETVLEAFREVNASGTTVLIVSHDPLVIQQIPARLKIEDGQARWESRDAS